MLLVTGFVIAGDLKKLLSAQTGLHPQEQKLLFKGKERDSKAYLDISGVKDRSKVVLIEDPINRERRYLEIRKNAKVERASKSISEVSLEVDKLASQVHIPPNTWRILPRRRDDDGLVPFLIFLSNDGLVSDAGFCS